MTLESNVFVARELAGEACWFREIIDHELKHVAGDRMLVRKYQDRIRDALMMAYASDESVPGGSRDDQGRAIVDTLGVMFEAMMRERAEAQRNVDSLDEYRGIMAACGGVLPSS